MPIFLSGPFKAISCDNIQFCRRGCWACLLLFLFVTEALGADLPAVPKTEQLPELSSMVPDREIVQSGEDVPHWKALWGEARSLVRAGAFEQAVEKYEALLSEKANLEEARWELARIWIFLRQFDKAATILELLLEAAPDNAQYLKSMALVMDKKGHFSRSVDLFKRACQKKPGDLEILAGLARNLLRLGNKKDALPVYEKLYALKSDDDAVRNKLVSLAFDLGCYDKARPHLIDLAGRDDASVEVLLMAAATHEKLGLDNVAIEYYRRILQANPKALRAQKGMAYIYEKGGRWREALDILLPLHEKNTADISLFFRLGRIYEKAGEFTKALPYVEKYFSMQPENKEALQSLINIRMGLGDKTAALRVQEKYFAVEPHPDPGMLEQAARLYDEMRRFKEAISLYRRLLESAPQNQHIIIALARDLLAIGDKEGALSFFKRLDSPDPKHIDIYRAMVDLLEHFGRNDELLEVLKTLYEMEPDNEQVVLKLASQHVARGDWGEAYDLLDKLALSEKKSLDFLEARAVLFEKVGWTAQAFDDYEKLLALISEIRKVSPESMLPDEKEIWFHCFTLAGELGKAAAVHSYYKKIYENPPPEGDSTFRMLAAALFRKSGDYKAALGEYTELLAAQKIETTGFKEEVFLGMASVYKEAGLEYEAEQAYRMALLQESDCFAALAGLFNLSLSAGRYDEAEVWFDNVSALSSCSGEGRPERDFDVRLMKARLLLAKGERRAALRVARRLFTELTTHNWLSDSSREIDQEDMEAVLALGRFYLTAGRTVEARDLCLRLLQSERFYPEPFVLMQKIYELRGESAKAEEIMSLASSSAGRDAGVLLRLAKKYKEYDMPAAIAVKSSDGLRQLPDSLTLRYLLAEGWMITGKSDEAIALLEQIVSVFSENDRAIFRLAELLFRNGRFEKALALCDKALGAEQLRPELLLLKARILWAQHDWSGSLHVYRDFLEPSVDDFFNEQLQRKRLSPASPVARKRSLWDVITFSNPKQPRFIETVFAPSHALKNKSEVDRTLNEIAASLSSLFRWQERFANELAARRSIERREYFQAVKQYEALIGNYPDDGVLLFDLAGVYSRLDRLGEEASIYERLSSLDADFPGLAAAKERNRLKQRPQLVSDYGYHMEEGRENAKAIKKEWEGVRFWFSPRSQHEIDLSASRINYRSTLNDEESIWATRTYFRYDTSFLRGLSVSLGGGMEKSDTQYSHTTLFNFSLAGKIGDKLEGHFLYDRDVTEDTVASLVSVVREDVEIGVALDVSPRLQIGGDYAYTDFSDGNLTEGYTLWSEYIVSPEPKFLALRYSYDFKDTREASLPGFLLADEYERDDYSYWTPRNYWLNQFGLYYKHNLSGEMFKRGVPRYFTAEYSLGHDSDGHGIQRVKGDFVVEWTQHVIMKAAAEIVSSKTIRSRDVSLSIGYRW